MTILVKMLTLTRLQPKSKKEVMMSILLFATTGLTVSFIKKQTNKKLYWNLNCQWQTGAWYWTLVLKSQCRITTKILLSVPKALSGLAPQYTSCLLTVHSPVIPLSSSAADLWTVPRIRSKWAEGAFSHCGAVLWNKLPADQLNCASKALNKSIFIYAVLQ